MAPRQPLTLLRRGPPLQTSTLRTPNQKWSGVKPDEKGGVLLSCFVWCQNEAWLMLEGSVCSTPQLWGRHRPRRGGGWSRGTAPESLVAGGPGRRPSLSGGAVGVQLHQALEGASWDAKAAYTLATWELGVGGAAACPLLCA